MPLDASQHYVFRMGSDNQIRIHWTGRAWRYEFLAGGVIFDELLLSTEEALSEALHQHGLDLKNFVVDEKREGEAYSQSIQKRLEELKARGLQPCPKHGYRTINLDGRCEACLNTDYPDDFKGTEG